MGIRFDHFSKVVRGAGEGEIVLSGEGMSGLSTIESLFVARGLRFRGKSSYTK